MSQRTPAGATALREADQPPSRRWWILAVVGLAQLMVVLDATIVNIALPSAQRDLGFSDADRQWIVTAYSLAFGSLLLLGGRLADLVGRKRVFLVGVVGFAAASALAGAAGSFTLLVSGRALQGLFGALLAPAALSLLNTTFTDARERAKAFGVYGAIAGTGGAIGLLLGGLLTEHLSWRWTLYVNLVFAALALTGGVLLLQRSRRNREATLDIPGTVLVSAGLFGVVYGLSNAESHGWSSPMTWGFLAGGALLVAAFAFRQTRAPHPLLPPRIVLDRDRGASFAAVMVAASGMFGVFLFLTYYLQATLHYTPVKTGLAFLPMIAALMVSAQVATNLSVPRLGAKAAVPAGMALAAAGMVWLTGIGLTTSYATHVLPPLLVLGLGLGHVMPPAMSQATARVAPADAGAASATVNTMQQVGGSIGTALLNTLATSAATAYLASRVPSPATLAQAQLHSYTTAFWWSAGIFTLGLVVTGLLYRRPSAALPQQRTEEAHAPVVHI
ncbi:DHA2 family efflux MFS transporter permease subunit [Streptacidiphilus sp. ASG 303]|uniref:DHA2 family efflux MFS transporter permease subunit n=1 Tax=Streptacidiphilus sp. ASG 303 TaxID=2896847 RepID=UPI001E2C3EA3|nr:DHA2 family efflux MFS transporter permease subunit [Streptacidiphilus sp. ASG 303]MCD0485938.1 DHA2 family efflux MFS transporter permease subunit [Streptacidiphilus sp. ASG 303]